MGSHDEDLNNSPVETVSLFAHAYTVLIHKTRKIT